MSKSDKLAIALTAAAVGIGFLIGGPVWGIVFLAIALVFLILYIRHDRTDSLFLLLREWLIRNRGSVITWSCLLIVVIVGTFGYWLIESRADQNPQSLASVPFLSSDLQFLVAPPSVSSTKLSFKGRVGAIGVPQTITITNRTDAPLFISVKTTGDFYQTNDCAPEMTTGDNCNVAVTFIPKTRGFVYGRLDVASSDPLSRTHNPVSVDLSGYGL